VEGAGAKDGGKGGDENVNRCKRVAGFGVETFKCNEKGRKWVVSPKEQRAAYGGPQTKRKRKKNVEKAEF